MLNVYKTRIFFCKITFLGFKLLIGKSRFNNRENLSK